ncbi:hypothetical protein H6G64_23530 [Calothrix sp. FACHB-156]|nr:hypothetical protein [Nostoc linckia FACHB-104]MBD2339946.1 hypothetical protein [Calothrix sp. FACHB-156]
MQRYTIGLKSVIGVSKSSHFIHVPYAIASPGRKSRDRTRTVRDIGSRKH